MIRTFTKIFMVFAILFWQSNLLMSNKKDKIFDRGTSTKKSKFPKQRFKKEKKIYFKLNTEKTFEKIRKQNTFVFTVGNDNYEKISGFPKLKQCFNDSKLLKQIFIHCLKVDEQNIFVNKDITINQFRDRFKKFIEKVKQDEDSAVIVAFSGHGNNDGSLVFINGGMLRPDELKKLINSYKNDTILIIDACYSGKNEGPKEIFKQEPKHEFKSNSLRIYASLAHLTAKEIQYNNVFFRHVMPFYKNVLKINNMKGNGYFTAMIGLFFAEYNLKEDENISFKDLISYITNTGKKYVEYLAITGRENDDNEEEAKFRLNQQPIILPIKERVDFLNDNHNFILLQKPIEAVGFEPGITGGIFFPMSKLGKYYKSPAISTNLYLAYELDFIAKYFFIDFNFSFLSMNSKPNPLKRKMELDILTPSAGFKYYIFRTRFVGLSMSTNAGVAITFSRTGSFASLREESKTILCFYGDGDMSFRFGILENFKLLISGKFHYIKYKDEPLYGISIGAGVSHYF
ncbi:MAG: caspase family protein [Spirochaetota bacterium]|nr:caspase family protein [Spirochaetota bacterium]